MISIDDEKFLRGNVPMTKQEIRILTLAKAQLEKSNVTLHPIGVLCDVKNFLEATK